MRPKYFRLPQYFGQMRCEVSSDFAYKTRCKLGVHFFEVKKKCRITDKIHTLL